MSDVTTAGGLTIEHAEQNREYRDAPSLSFMDARAPLDTMPSGSFSSSNVHSALYDFSARTLFVRYLRDGPDAVYQYWDVPAQVWSGLVAANSKGQYVNTYIAYEYRYALFGRDDFPDQQSLDNDRIRRFVYSA